MAFGTPKAKFEITAEDKSDRALKQVKKNLGTVKEGMGALSGVLGPLLGVAGIGALTRQLVQMGGALTDIATRVDATVQGIQALQMLAMSTGTSGEVMERAMRNITTRAQQGLDQMGKGKGPQYEAIVRMGIDPYDFARRMTTEERMEAVAKGFARRGDSARAHTDLQVLLGEEAGPALKEALVAIARQGIDALKNNPGIASEAAAQWADSMSDTTALGAQGARGWMLEAAYQTRHRFSTDPLGTTVGVGGIVADKAKRAIDAPHHLLMKLDDESRQLFREIRDAVQNWSVFK